MLHAPLPDGERGVAGSRVNGCCLGRQIGIIFNPDKIHYHVQNRIHHPALNFPLFSALRVLRFENHCLALSVKRSPDSCRVGLKRRMLASGSPAELQEAATFFRIRSFDKDCHPGCWRCPFKARHKVVAMISASCNPRLFWESSNACSSQIRFAWMQRSWSGRGFEDGSVSRIHCRWRFVFSPAVASSISYFSKWL